MFFPTAYMHVLSIAGYLDGDSAAENTLQGATGLEQIADDPRRCLFCGMFGDRKPSVMLL